MAYQPDNPYPNFVGEPLELQAEQPGPTARVITRIRGASTRRRYGVVSPLIARRVVASVNGCAHLRFPEKLPGLLDAVRDVLASTTSKQPAAINRLIHAAIACGAIQE